MPAPSSEAQTAQPTIEEDRLTGAVPQRLIQHGGLAGAAPRLLAALADAGSAPEATAVVARHGRSLWREAIRRLREGDGDDRPLYWARLELARAVRGWRPGFPVDTGELLGVLGRESRGIGLNGLPAGPDRLRVVVTGFDPFGLDTDVRRGNPSGAAALALHGTVVRTDCGRSAHIEAVVLPVRWRDFTDGVVEQALRPYLEPGPRRVHLFMTVSQGRPGVFDVERHNAGWRGEGTDNLKETAPGPVPPVPGAEGVPNPPWTVGTLPHAAMTAATTGPHTVRGNTAVTELPAGSDEPVHRADGPTDGSAARAGGGGDYLSNEVAYRATLLRDRVAPGVPGGHLHTPVLRFAEENASEASGRFTDGTLVGSRMDITTQIRTLLAVAAGTLPVGDDTE
ncbi:pyroglutamyl peptidase [Streptomyces spiramenti]|uniref:Pyroglutamyl peptidase n=1 Tax=Streptomyces spiramenti TaxID=2720606 RepID=A0ABX1AQ03_9ACTN|nr:pyroglutamyl peptidase [Streptomyces spiramenti]NJP66527.1 pyroglutamyl peptidase [Streptomyces spiramenti]